ncbi:MAG: hypothetical protein QXU18_01800 [Thermoplasmatales archaeon]
MRDVRKAIIGSGFSWRPSVLGVYFSTALDNAENRGLISHPWRMFFMGHKGDIETRYSTNKSLPRDMIEKVRSAYVKASRFFETESSGIKEDDLAKQLRETSLITLK